MGFVRQLLVLQRLEYPRVDDTKCRVSPKWQLREPVRPSICIHREFQNVSLKLVKTIIILARG